ncbi:hypothetical protein [Neobacillus sp. YIM B06451]|nr:hypothetical protein [Neobacillus sp. YIM B06451]
MKKEQSGGKGPAQQIENSPTGYGFVPAHPKKQESGGKPKSKNQ